MMNDDFNLDSVLKESDERKAEANTINEGIRSDKIREDLLKEPESVVEDLSDKDELTQDDFSDAKELFEKGESILKDNNSCDCATKKNHNSVKSMAHRQVTDCRKLETLGLIHETHDKYLAANYDYYNARADFYTNSANQDLCKDQCGKATEAVFREFANTNLLDLKQARDEAKFQYEQAKRVYDSL